MLSVWRLVACAALATVAAVAGCAGDAPRELREWTLVIDDEPGIPVTLPARLSGRVPEAADFFRLQTRWPVPADLTGRPLVLSIPNFGGVVELRVDGQLVPPLRADLGSSYRSLGQHVWRLPEALAAPPALGFELRVANTWQRARWLDSAPRVSAAAAGDAHTAFARWFNFWTGVAAMAFLSSIAFTYLVLFVLDRRRAEHGWLALQTIAAATYPAFVVGVTRGLGVPLEIDLLGAALIVAIGASTFAVDGQFGLRSPRRLLPAVSAAGIALCLLQRDSMTHATRTGWVTVVLVAVLFAYHIVRLVRCLRVDERQPGIVPNLIGWLLLIALAIIDFPVWLGLPDISGGLRFAPLGLTFFALAQFSAISAALLVNLRRAQEHREEVEVLNAELRRQIGERSRQLTMALSRLARPQRPRELSAGATVDGRYRVIRLLGSGAMGAVYEIERTSDGRRLALKILTRVPDAYVMARFAREAQLVAAIEHPNVVEIFDVGFSSEGFMYLVMELIDGTSLREHVARYGDPVWALPLIHQLAAGLAATHARGVVHRDLKPANVLLDGTGAGRVKIADFGVSSMVEAGEGPGEVAELFAELEQEGETAARVQSAAAPATVIDRRLPAAVLQALQEETGDTITGGIAGAARGGRPSRQSLTQTGFIVGTPVYMAPELARGSSEASPASDVFSLGVVAFELLTGTRPFRAPPCLEALHGRPLPTAGELAALQPSLSEAVAGLLQRALDPAPAARPTAAEIAAATALAVSR